MSNQQEWNSAAMEHYKPAKLEGPAQQRCGVCDWPIVDNGTRVEHIGFDHPAVPATPVPSQPAAREQGLVINESINDPALLKVIRWEIVDRSSNRAEWFALCHRREDAERIVDAVNARQQTAAKDAEIADLRRQRDLEWDSRKAASSGRIAAERERDSLREAADFALAVVPRNSPAWSRLDAALKAGKE